MNTFLSKSGFLRYIHFFNDCTVKPIKLWNRKTKFRQNLCLFYVVLMDIAL